MGLMKNDLARFKRELVKAKTVGLDSMIFIYHFEKNPKYHLLTLATFLAVEQEKLKGVTSVLSLLESLSSPRLEGDLERMDDFRRFFREEKNLRTYGLDFEISEEAASWRRKYDLKTPDAVQLATACLSGAKAFVTNDNSFRKIKDFPILFLKDFVR